MKKLIQQMVHVLFYDHRPWITFIIFHWHHCSESITNSFSLTQWIRIGIRQCIPSTLKMLNKWTNCPLKPYKLSSLYPTVGNLYNLMIINKQRTKQTNRTHLMWQDLYSFEIKWTCRAYLGNSDSHEEHKKLLFLWVFLFFQLKKT